MLNRTHKSRIPGGKGNAGGGAAGGGHARALRQLSHVNKTQLHREHRVQDILYSVKGA